MKTAVIGEDGAGAVTDNESLVALLIRYGSTARTCQPYRANRKARSSDRSNRSARTSTSGLASTISTI